MQRGNISTFFMFVTETKKNTMCLKEYSGGESLYLNFEPMLGTYGIDLYLTFEYRIKVNNSLIKTNINNLYKELTQCADGVSKKIVFEDEIKKKQEIQIILKNYSHSHDEEKNIPLQKLKKIINIFSVHEGGEDIPIPIVLIQKINKAVDEFKRSQPVKRHTI